ncbi:uncharacterized protein LOC123673316 [Harmonia axyridis]|uniref:uncharacterized protein LOC123673316 n=1 Tax=Harmonia axyridis TaxID=115357 RepID=UPI001E276231|nr:uncharacterized protein LOC123673316 [Harmonia axyridis]
MDNMMSCMLLRSGRLMGITSTGVELRRSTRIRTEPDRWTYPADHIRRRRNRRTPYERPQPPRTEVPTNPTSTLAEPMAEPMVATTGQTPDCVTTNRTSTLATTGQTEPQIQTTPRRPKSSVKPTLRWRQLVFDESDRTPYPPRRSKRNRSDSSRRMDDGSEQSLMNIAFIASSSKCCYKKDFQEKKKQKEKHFGEFFSSWIIPKSSVETSEGSRSTLTLARICITSSPDSLLGIAAYGSNL